MLIGSVFYDNHSTKSHHQNTGDNHHACCPSHNHHVFDCSLTITTFQVVEHSSRLWFKTLVSMLEASQEGFLLLLGRFFCRYFGAPGRLFADGVALLGAKARRRFAKPFTVPVRRADIITSLPQIQFLAFYDGHYRVIQLR